MPWLYYTADPRTILKSNDIKMRVAFASDGKGTQEPVSTLSFYFAVYSFNGTFINLEPLSNHLQLCSSTSNYASQSSKPSFLSFGTFFENKCDFDSQILLSNSTPPTLFYDMYILDASDNSLIPVPVRIRNYRNSGGVKVNENENDNKESEIVDDVLTRRFFIYDTWSGRSTLGNLQVCFFLYFFFSSSYTLLYSSLLMFSFPLQIILMLLKGGEICQRDST